MQTQSQVICVDDKIVPESYHIGKGKTVEQLFVNKVCEKDFFGEKIVGEIPHFEAFSESDIPLQETEAHALFTTWHLAYSGHYPVEITPDQIRLLIIQGLALHINLHSEELRDKFVNHEDKKNIVVRRDDFVYGSGSSNPWTEVFGQFTEKIRNDIKDPELVDLVQKNYSTSTPNTTAAMNVAIMDSFQKYYNYILTTRCGIPSINLKGTTEDWENVLILINSLDKYDLNWWTVHLKNVVKEIINTSKNNVNQDFWKNMVKVHNLGSGGPGYSGWMRYFFPYLQDYKERYSRQDFDEKYIFSTEIPSGLSSAPFVWDYFGENHKMTFYAGFLGMSFKDGYLCPEIHWAIVEKD